MKILPFTIPVKKEESMVANHEQNPDFYPYYHRHKELQITYIIKGQGSLLLNNNIFSFMPDHLYLVGMNQAHLFRRSNLRDHSVESDQVELMNIFIDLNGPLSGIFSLPEFRQTNQLLKSIGLAQVKPEVILKARIMIEEIIDSEGTSRIIKLLALIDLMLAHLKMISMREDVSYSDSDGSRLNQVIQFLWSHYDQSISLSAAAQLVNMSPEAFSRYFKKRTNKTFISYLNELRIHQACKLLQNSIDLPMGEIAYSSGFNNATHFNRVFKWVSGKTPSQYKRELLLMDR